MQLFKKKKSYQKICEKVKSSPNIHKTESLYNQSCCYYTKDLRILQQKYQIHRNFTPEKLAWSSWCMQLNMQAEMQKTSLAAYVGGVMEKKKYTKRIKIPRKNAEWHQMWHQDLIRFCRINCRSVSCLG